MNTESLFLYLSLSHTHTHPHTNSQSFIVTKVVYKESSLFYDMGCEKKTGSTRKERDRERDGRRRDIRVALRPKIELVF